VNHSPMRINLPTFALPVTGVSLVNTAFIQWQARDVEHRGLMKTTVVELPEAAGYRLAGKWYRRRSPNPQVDNNPAA
jgi:hypothetical protein